MKVLHNLLDIPKADHKWPEIGLTIGNFDGVHIGHRQLLQKIKADCEARNLLFVVVTFIPHPQKILQPDKERFLINSYEQRRNLLSEMGVDILVEMKFTRDFSTLKAEDFLSRYLLAYPNLKNFYLGYDFAFGANKEGGHDLVNSICHPRGIKVEVQPKFEYKNEVVSSSLIRDLILEGKVDKVEQFYRDLFILKVSLLRAKVVERKLVFLLLIFRSRKI